MTTIAGLSNEILGTLAGWEAPLIVSAFVPVDFSKPQALETLSKALSHLEQATRNALAGRDDLDAAATSALVDHLVPPTLLDDMPRSARGLALFASLDRSVHVALPIEAGPSVDVGDRVDLLRLLPALVGDVDYFALTIDKKGAQLFRGSRFGFEPVPVPEMPGSIDEALWYVRREPGLTATEDLRKDDVRQYIHMIDKAITPVLNGSAAHLVVIGVEYEAAMFINHTHYRHTGDIAITGSPEAMSAQELHRRSWDFVQSRARAAGEALERLHELAGTGKTATDPDEIVVAGRDGAVGELLLARSVTDAGETPPAIRAARPIVATAADEALLHRAIIHVVDDDALPVGTTVAAVLRY